MEELNYIIGQLMSAPYAKVRDANHIDVRCPICGDSSKHLDGAHCGIWIREDAPLIYHCWICESSGVVDQNFLRDLGIADLELCNTVNRFNKTNMSKKKTAAAFVNVGKCYDLKIPSIRNRHKSKVDYVSERLGINFTNKSLEFLRVITSIKDFLEVNELDPSMKFARMVDALDRDYVGFLTTNKTSIVFRSLLKDPKYRYIKYPIFDGIDLSEKCYTIPMSVNPMTDSIELNLCEGPFDILGVFFNVKKADTDNKMYAAVCGSGYLRVVKFFLKKGFIANLNVNIYSDKDKGLNWYKPILRQIPWINRVNIFYNEMEGEKDFGVPKDRIITVKAVVK